jgi:hypothetical protein
MNGRLRFISQKIIQRQSANPTVGGFPSIECKLHRARKLEICVATAAVSPVHQQHY